MVSGQVLVEYLSDVASKRSVMSPLQFAGSI